MWGEPLWFESIVVLPFLPTLEWLERERCWASYSRLAPLRALAVPLFIYIKFESSVLNKSARLFCLVAAGVIGARIFYVWTYALCIMRSGPWVKILCPRRLLGVRRNWSSAVALRTRPFLSLFLRRYLSSKLDLALFALTCLDLKVLECSLVGLS